jgi:hypothetical protein
MPSIPGALRAYARDARAASAHAPVEVLLGLVVTVTFVAAMHAPGSDDWWLRLAAGAALAFPPVFGLSVLAARAVLSPGVRWAATAGVLLLAGAFAGLVFDPDREAEVWRCVSLVAAAVLALLSTPAVGPAAGVAAARDRYWRFNAALLVRGVVVGAYAVTLYAALAGAVAAVASLFELDTPEHLYQDLAGAVFFGLLPWVVVGGLPGLVAPPRAESGEAPPAVRLLGRYLYSLVLTLYLAILAAYTLKVAVTRELPRNLLSPIVLLAGLGGFLGALYLEPLQHDREGGYAARLIRWFPVVLLPLLPLALWGVWVRVDQHGWTEFRYLRFALLLGLLVLAAAGVERRIRRRPPLLAAVTAVLGAVLLLSALGPWSAQTVSRRDQQARLRSGLLEVGLLRDAQGSITLPTDSVPQRRRVPRALHDRITGAAQYLYREHGPGSLRGIIANADRFASGPELARALPIEARCEPEELRHLGSQLATETPVRGLPAGTLYRLRAESVDARSPAEPAGARGLELRLAGSQLRLSSREGPGWTAAVELRPLVDELAGRPVPSCDARIGPDTGLTPEQARFPLVDATGTPRGVLILTSLAADREGDDGTGPLRVRHVEALAVVR